PAPYIVCAGCLLSHPGRTLGAQLDATLASIVGTIIGIIYTLAGVAAATKYNIDHPGSSAGTAINCAFLMFGVFFAQIVRQKAPKLFFFTIQFLVIVMFSMTSSAGNTEMHLSLSSQYGIPFFIGTFVSLVVNLFLWPETAMDGLGRALNQTLCDTREMLDTITRQFFLDPESPMVPAHVVDELAAKMRQGMVKINTAYKEAKYEVVYAYTCSSDLNSLRRSLDMITRHLNLLGSNLKTERILFKSASSISKHQEEIVTDSYQPIENDCLHQSVRDAVNSYLEDGTYHASIKPHDYHRKESSQSDTGHSESSTNDENISKEPRMKEGSKSKCHTTPLKRFSEPQNMGHEEGSKEKRKGHVHSLSTDDANQETISSVRSFLNLAKLSVSAPKPPPKSEKKLESTSKRLMVTYLDTLRDPLISLAAECALVLDCIRDSLCDQLDISNDDDAYVQHKSVCSYLLHLLKIKTVNTEFYLKYLERKKRNASFLCSCADTMRYRIKQFDKCQKIRMQALYRLNQTHLHQQKLDSGLQEDLFLIFFFIFTMREIALGLGQMARDMRKIQEKTQQEIRSSKRQSRKKHLYMPQVTIQTWKKWFLSNNYRNVLDRGGYTFSYFQNYMPADIEPKNAEEEYRLSKITTNRNNQTLQSDLESKNVNVHEDDTEELTQMRHRKKTQEYNLSSLAKLESGPSSSLKETEKVPFILRFRYRLWFLLQFFQNYEFRFALKMSIVVGALTIPAWIPSTREWFAAIRGQWAALTVICIMSPTSGGTLSAGLWRLVATLVGGFWAWAALEINSTSGALLSGFGVILAIPLFLIHFSTSYSKVALISLVTYVVIGFQSASPISYPESIATMVWQRTTTLVIGLVAALLLNWMVWPFVARDAVRKTLASAIGDLGDYYAYVMGTFLYHDEGLFPTIDEYKEAEKIERRLESMLTTCGVLLELTDHEPRLKGPFPKEFYREMITSCMNMLDCLVSMRIAFLKMSPSVKKTVWSLDQNFYRRDMVASILLHFYTLSASLRAKIPLPSFVPSARQARLKILHRRRPEDHPKKLLRYQNLTWFSMSFSTEELIEELEHLTELIRFIVGDSRFTSKARRLEKSRKFQIYE
ncbi:hypothetical protein CU098_012605, partial [Rhizopus stolonifer]